MSEVLLFGGTTEGRALADFLRRNYIDTLMWVATDYGEAVMREPESSVRLKSGRLDMTQMTELLRKEFPGIVVDATHPYAREASENISKACSALGLRCIRISRESLDAEGCEVFPDMDGLMAWLKQVEGGIFAATGLKSAEAFTRLPDYESRVFLRILPALSSLDGCLRLGYRPDHLICMQGPFSTQMNYEMFRHTGAKILVTKQSGTQGGFLEKLEAAKSLNMKIALLQRPSQDAGMSVPEAESFLSECFK